MRLESLFGQENTGKKRLGRGIGSKKGKTAGRGTKGQLSRTGKKIRPGFEGGQLPLVQRVPKRKGFRSIRPKSTAISLDRFNGYKKGTKINLEFLIKENFIEDKKSPYKILAGQKWDQSVSVEVEALSQGARKQIEETRRKQQKEAAKPQNKPKE